MNAPHKFAFGLLIVLFCLGFTTSVFGQEISFSYNYRLDAFGATAAPELGGMPRVEFPDAARKNGVEGTLIAEMTLGADGKVSGYKFIETLPHGIEEAIKTAFNTLGFKPATRDGEPMSSTLRLEYTVSMVYDEADRNIKKPEITVLPYAAYPVEELSTKRKGEVEVGIIFNKDGTMKLVRVQSVMPRSFDDAAIEAAKKIEFTPGSHKKTKDAVSVKMTVVFKFKP